MRVRACAQPGACAVHVPLPRLFNRDQTPEPLLLHVGVLTVWRHNGRVGRSRCHEAGVHVVLGTEYLVPPVRGTRTVTYPLVITQRPCPETLSFGRAVPKTGPVAPTV